MSGAVQALVVDGPTRLRGQVVASRTEVLRYLTEDTSLATDPQDYVTWDEQLLTMHRLRVGNRQFQVWLTATEPTQADVSRGILALIDADPALVADVEVR